jgi:hypothetical protein
MQAANRQQMRKAAAPHCFRILVDNAPSVSGRQRCRNRTLPAPNTLGNMRSQPRPADFEPTAPAISRCRSGDLDASPCPPRCANPFEPGTLGKIIGARNGGTRRRHQPCIERHPCARLQPVRRTVFIDIHAKLMRQIGVAGRTDHQPDTFTRGQMFNGNDFGDEAARNRALQRFSIHPLSTNSDQRTTDSGNERKDAKAAKQPGCATEHQRG